MPKVFAILLVLSLFLIGCSDNNEKKSVADKKYQILTNAEQQIYQEFQQSLDINKLKDVEPISIAKFYFQAGIDKKHDVEYALYTDREDYIRWSKEEDEKIPEKHRGTKDYLLGISKNLAKGTFVATTDLTGYIEFISADDTQTKHGFQLIKNENDIWQVAFMPLQ